MSGFVWFSFGSDKTGPELGTALGFDTGKKTPNFADYDVVVGWGCKPGEKYDPEALAQLIGQNQVRILNHPDAVEANRNKLGTLQKLKEAGVLTPGFLEFDPNQCRYAAEELIPLALDRGEISLPLILLTRGNRGEPIFCYTIEDVKAALRDTGKKAMAERRGRGKNEPLLCYARSFDHGDEYRIHVFRDTALCAQKKNITSNPLKKTADGLKEKIQKIAKREELTLDEDTTGFVVGVVARELMTSASQLKKSTKMGWKWIDWDMELVPVEIAELAIEAMDSAQLDLGAVGISYTDKVPRVLSISTAPSLSEEQMELYVAEIQAFAKAGSASKTPRKKGGAEKERKASPELIARLHRKVKALSAEEAEGVLKSLED